MTQGKRANESGRMAEQLVCTVLRTKGVTFRRQVVVGTSIYGHQLRADIVVEPTAIWPRGLAIEVKWQDAAGSVDEKFPYIAANVRSGAFGRPVAVVLGGGKAKPGAIRWLAMQQLEAADLVGVFSIEEFASWVARQ